MKLLGLLLVLALAQAKHEAFIGWKSYYIGLSTKGHFETLQTLKQKYELDILGLPILGREGVVLVKPEHQEPFLQEAEAAGITTRIHIDDVKRQLDYEDVLIASHRSNSSARSGGRSLPYDSYQTVEAIDDYLDYVGRQYPNLVTVVNPANSFEGHPIKYVKISTTNFQDHSKPVIFIDGGIHSREWISMPTVTWAIHKLVEDVTERDLLDNFDWILLPLVNPDGYRYSYETYRFWRKTRSTDQSALSVGCPGVDGNRNYDFFWNTVGTSNFACSDIYAGGSPFSEIETRVVRDILQENLSRIALYLTMHSFGSMILYPWGHDGSLSNNALGLHTVGVAMADEIARHSLPNFPRYVVGNSALVLNYPAAGASEDYAHSLGVPLSYTYELPGLSTGFILNPIYIEPVCRETWAGIVVGARRAGELFRKKWKSYYIGLSTKEHFDTLRVLEDKYELDILGAPIQGREGIVLVKPEHQDSFIQDAEAIGITIRTHVDDVKRQLDYEDILVESHRSNSSARSGGRFLPYDSYQTVEAIDAYLDYVGREYPETVTVVNPANSYDGFPIKYVKISTTNFQDQSKPVIVIDGGIHSREWISIPTVTWAIRKLVEDVTERDLLDNFDWIILPLVNPDGYRFSYQSDRFWRKTRSRDQHAQSNSCPGVDGNRNYDFFWNTVGTSNNPCSDTYAGSRPFSEVETRVVRDILNEHLHRIALYLTIHSFGSMILYPWGHDGSLSHNAFALHTVGVAMAEKIMEHTLPIFPRYVVGNAALVLWYGAAGAAEDYAHLIGVPLSYTNMNYLVSAGVVLYLTQFISNKYVRKHGKVSWLVPEELVNYSESKHLNIYTNL